MKKDAQKTDTTPLMAGQAPSDLENKQTPQARLIGVNNDIATLSQKLNTTGRSALPGMAVNAGIFLALSYLAPGLGMFKGAIASAAGSLTHTVTQKVAGNDKGEKMKTAMRTLDGIGLSEGVRAIGGLIHNHTGSMIFETAVPTLVQSGFHYNTMKDATEAGLMKRMRELQNERASLMEQLQQTDDMHTAYKALKMD